MSSYLIFVLVLTAVYIIYYAVIVTKDLYGNKDDAKTKNYLKKKAKNVMSSGRLKAMALMLLVGCGAAMAQNSAGDYTACTTALTQVTEEINFGVNPTKYNTCIKSYLSNNNTSYTTNYSVKMNFNNT